MSEPTDRPSTRPDPDSAASAMAAVVSELLDVLDQPQRQALRFPFPSDDERTTWFYTPTDHGGLPLTEMESAQHRMVHRLLAAALSTPGYVTAALILGQENVLDQLEGFAVDFGRDRGRDPLLYWLALFGDPGDRIWGWRFGGHHLSLHFTIIDGRVVASTPLFFGMDPAATPLLGPHLHRPLGGAEDLGRELVRSLDESQSVRAVVAAVPPLDLVGSNRTELTEGDRPLDLPLIWRGRFEQEMDRLLDRMQHRGETDLGLTDDHLDAVAFTARPRGLAATDLRDDQRDLLQDVLATYVDRLTDDLAQQQWDRLRAEGGIDRLHFLWAGSTEVGQPHYYRLQGGDWFIEYDNAQRGGNHVHSVWRDLSHDFGRDPLAAHYAGGHRH